MKTLFTIILATVAFVSAPAQNRIIKQNRQVASFSAINASGGWDVIVRQGDRQSVSIEVSEEVLDRAVVEVKNGTLHIYNKGNNLNARNCNADFSGAADGSIRVTGRLDITVSGSADVTCFGNPGDVNKRVNKSSSLKFS